MCWTYFPKKQPMTLNYYTQLCLSNFNLKGLLLIIIKIWQSDSIFLEKISESVDKYKSHLFDKVIEVRMLMRLFTPRSALQNLVQVYFYFFVSFSFNQVNIFIQIFLIVLLFLKYGSTFSIMKRHCESHGGVSLHMIDVLLHLISLLP